MSAQGKRAENVDRQCRIAAAFDAAMEEPVLILGRDRRARLYRELAAKFGASERTVRRAVERYSKTDTGR